MISEPKSKQMHVAEYHQLVTLNYMMATHIATLATVVLGKTKPAPDPEYLPVVRVIAANLDQAIERLKTTADTLNASAGLIKSEPEGNQAGEGLSKLNQRMTDMVEIRKKELADGITEAHFSTSLTGVKLINDQFNFIWKISEDLLKTLRA
jgi:hypothetical protein